VDKFKLYSVGEDPMDEGSNEVKAKEEPRGIREFYVLPSGH
jgi:hypothetical protein